MAEAKTAGMDDSRAKDKAERKKDLTVCMLGFLLVILAKIVA